MLREVAHLDAGAELHAALVGVDVSRDHLEQRRLARAVLAHHRPALAAPHDDIQAVVHDAASVALRDAFEHDDLLAGSRRRPEIELHDAALLRQLDLFDLLERLHAALHLRRLRRVRREPLDETLLLGEHRLLSRIRRPRKFRDPRRRGRGRAGRDGAIVPQRPEAANFQNPRRRQGLRSGRRSRRRLATRPSRRTATNFVSHPPPLSVVGASWFSSPVRLVLTPRSLRQRTLQ